MFGSTWYHGTIRRYVILFGTLFNDIYIRRYDAAGNVINLIKVPITYGPKDKVLARLEADPNLNRPYATILPYMSFEMLDVKYAGDRKLATTVKVPYLNTQNRNLSTFVYNPVPYDLTFRLNILVKNAEDGAKILEQILPFFTPDWTTTIKIIDDPQIILDIPTVLNQVNSQDTWEGNFVDRRYITWTLTFTMHSYLFGPIKKSKIIKKAISNVLFTDKVDGILPDDATRIDETITITPGLTANGQPTSNSAESIDYSEIDWNDDYGYIIDIETGKYANT